MRIGSLCSGGGGLDMAVESVFGAETVWHCEINGAASKVLAYHWPGIPNYRDLIATDWAAVQPIDILCAGWPCQPWSSAGKKLGAEDERAIWPHIAGAVRLLRPQLVVLENVSTVARVGELERVANSLAGIGYDLRWTCVRASDVGAPHQRKRIFIVAHAEGIRWRVGHAADEWSPAGEVDSFGNHRVSASDSARDGWARLNGGTSGETTRDGGEWEPAGGSGGTSAPVELLPTPCAQHSGNTPENHLAKKPGRKVVTDLAILIENGLLASGGELLPTPCASDESGGGMHPDRRVGHSRQLIDYVKLEPERWGKYGQAIARWEQIIGAAPSPTEPNRNGKPRLNPAFSEWMMGWPAGHVTAVPGVSRNDQLRIIGNGVVPQQAEAALRYLLSVAEVAA